MAFPGVNSLFQERCRRVERYYFQGVFTKRRQFRNVQMIFVLRDTIGDGMKCFRVNIGEFLPLTPLLVCRAKLTPANIGFADEKRAFAIRILSKL
ncbi:hypothetical protein AWH01_14195 [Escherichia coli]|nr:hypothetical protein AWH01_14195 [Escherichia coli]